MLVFRGVMQMAGRSRNRFPSLVGFILALWRLGIYTVKKTMVQATVCLAFIWLLMAISGLSLD